MPEGITGRNLLEAGGNGLRLGFAMPGDENSLKYFGRLKLWVAGAPFPFPSLSWRLSGVLPRTQDAAGGVEAAANAGWPLIVNVREPLLAAVDSTDLGQAVSTD